MIRYPVSQPTLGPVERLLVNKALDDNRITQGAMVAEFEKILAGYLNVEHVVATTSGTTALHLALAALGLGPGDEVLVPDLTFVATANAVAYTGARVVLVDVDPKTWCMDPADAQRKLTDRTRAIVPVHLYGVPCDMDALAVLAHNHGLVIIEDSAEGLGGSYEGYALGSLGQAGVFSFYGNKVVTCGEGGAVSTNSATLAGRLRFLRGQALDPERRYYHPEVGFNYRMTDLQAAVGIGQFSHLLEMLQQRREIVDLYSQLLCYYGVKPIVLPNTQHAPWLFTLQLNAGSKRDGLMRYLDARGIETRPVFVPLHRMPMYAGDDTEFPYASRLGDAGVSLPTYPGLTCHDVLSICDDVVTYLERGDQ